MADKRLYSKEIPMKGRLITSEDPAVIGEHFQELKNMRYTDRTIRTIGGHSKINSTSIPNPKARSGIFFDKSGESHVLVEAYNSGETSSKIYDNTATIPNTGDFSVTEVYSPLSGAGRFSLAPNGYVAYANGAETCIYGGDESDIGGFINYAPDDSFRRDQTEMVTNLTETGTGNIAVLKRVAKSTANDILLLHLENNDTDDSPSGHTLTDTNVTYNSAAKKFGSYGAVLNGTDASFTVPDDSDFDFSGTDATWTIDFWGTVDNLTSPHPIYYKETDASNYFGIYILTDGSIKISHFATGSETLNSGSGFTSATGVISAGTQYHIEIVRDEGNWYVFVDGDLYGLLVDSTDIGTETGDVKIGTDGSDYYDGYIDEYRISSLAVHASGFEVPSSAYGDGYTTYLYAGFILPVSQIKFYISTANTSAASASVQYWGGSEWSPTTTFSDGTSSGGVSMSQTGALSFDSTAGSASVKEISGTILYWYRVKIDDADDDFSVYHVTGRVPFQPIKDVWSGVPNDILSFLKNTTKYEDYTTNVFESNYIATYEGTYADVTSLTTAQSILCGFPSRQIGIRFNIVGGKENTTANTIAKVYYWDGSDWASVGAISDGTSKDGISFGQAGLMTWEQLEDGVEFKTEFSGLVESAPTLYYYKIEFTQQLNEGRIDSITGVPAQKTIGNYKFPLQAMNRLWLFSDQDNEKNKSICSSKYTTTVFNGSDSIDLTWGDEKEITAAAWVYSQYGANVYSNLIVFKRNETWVLIGDDPEVWKQYKISSSIGCVAPETVRVIETPTDQTKGVNRSSVVVFQGGDGIYMTDGRPPVLISKDIDIFDKRKGLIASPEESFAFIDVENQEYHWCFTQSTHTDKEYVLSYKDFKWFEIERPSPLQYGMEVKTTTGITHTYGFIDDYMLRLEHTNSFDGTGISSTVHFGDILLAGVINIETNAHYHNLIGVAKSNTDQNIAITHYGDSSTTGNSFTASPVKSGYRLIRTSDHQKFGSHIFHSWKFEITTDDETTGFEPLFFSCLYEQVRQYTKEHRE